MYDSYNIFFLAICIFPLDNLCQESHKIKFYWWNSNITLHIAYSFLPEPIFFSHRFIWIKMVLYSWIVVAGGGFLSYWSLKNKINSFVRTWIYHFILSVDKMIFSSFRCFNSIRIFIIVNPLSIFPPTPSNFSRKL